MRSLILGLAIVVCHAVPGWAQLSLDSKAAIVLTGAGNAGVYGDLVVVPVGAGTIHPTAGAVVTVATEAKFVTVKARRSLFDVAKLTKVSERDWVITGAGRYLVEATSFDPERGIEEAYLEVVVGNTPPPPDPDNPDPPNPPDPPPPLDVVQVWAQATNDPLTAQGIASVYRQVREALECGRLDATTTWQVLGPATDGAIQIVGTGANWTSFRQNVSDLLATAAQQGKLDTPDEIGRQLYRIQQGLELSADGTVALAAAKTALILKQTNEVIDARR